MPHSTNLIYSYGHLIVEQIGSPTFMRLPCGSKCILISINLDKWILLSPAGTKNMGLDFEIYAKVCHDY